MFNFVSEAMKQRQEARSHHLLIKAKKDKKDKPKKEKGNKSDYIGGVAGGLRMRR